MSSLKCSRGMLFAACIRLGDSEASRLGAVPAAPGSALVRGLAFFEAGLAAWEPALFLLEPGGVLGAGGRLRGTGRSLFLVPCLFPLASSSRAGGPTGAMKPELPSAPTLKFFTPRCLSCLTRSPEGNWLTSRRASSPSGGRSRASPCSKRQNGQRYSRARRASGACSASQGKWTQALQGLPARRLRSEHGSWASQATQRGELGSPRSLDFIDFWHQGQKIPWE
mmetsp:Transcript_33083/g.92665  ORF Transcript_33083/g.92665 Transcript_33083/m.92665 type:complete len:224 (-) Transcript_33083:172-843(-)